MKLTFRFARLIVVLVCFAGFSHQSIAAQTDEAGTAPRSTPKKKSPPKLPTPSSPTKKTPPRTSPKSGSSAASKLGTISIAVNESDTEIFLDRADGGDLSEEPAFVSPGAPQTRRLRPGVYIVTARKDGFGEVKQSVTVTAGSVARVSVTMRSTMAWLTVTTNVLDAKIEIEGVGEFEGEVRNLALAPGSYKVTAKRLGYITQSKSVTLAQAGIGGTATIYLPPVPIDAMLAEASRKIDAGDHQGALALAEQVLAVDPEHATANYTAGLACLSMGDARSSDHFLRSIRAGNTIGISATLLVKSGGGSALEKISLMLDRNYVYIRAESRPEHSFRLFKPDLVSLATKLDRYSQPYIELEGRGDANGRRDKRELLIYSQLTLLRPNRKDTFCSTRPSSRSCLTDVNAIHRLLIDWQIRLR